MHIDSKQIQEHGFIILRDVVPPEHLDGVRRAVEHMVDHRREVSEQMRLPHEPCGAWAASDQPRIVMDADCDGESALAIEFLLGETALGVCRKLINTGEVVLHYMACICSSESHDAGPAHWHRDIAPGTPAPLLGMMANMEHHGPSYLQWNIALYEDSVFCIVPGSHRRVNTEAENRQLAEDATTPLPGAMPVELGPGDGVVYIHLLLHRGSNYTRKLRRTIHAGYRPIGFPAMPNTHWRHWEPGFLHYLSDPARQQFEHWDKLFFAELDLFAGIFHSIIAGNEATFRATLERLHPSIHQRLVTLAMLNRMADRLHRFKQDEPVSPCYNGRDDSYLGGLFTVEQTTVLRRRFEQLDRRVRSSGTKPHLGLQGSTCEYESEKMPTDFTVDDFIASWNDGH